jgi:PAS domain S-box-containing protein/putative nucleotidyltransferase with HDIG domain
LKKIKELNEKKWKATNEELLREIAEREKIENALNENNKLLKSILDGSSSISIISTDRDGKILFWNTGAQRLFGYTPKEAIGKLTMNSLYPDNEETRTKVQEVRQNIYERKRETSLEIKERTKDGRILWIKLTACPRFDEDGKVIGILGIGEDVTERRRAEEELKESEKKYSTIVERGSDGIVIIQDSLLKFVNTKMCEITGRALKDLVNKPFLRFVALEYRQLVSERYEQRLAGQQVENKYEIEIIARDEKRIPVEINATVVEYEGNPADMAIIRDVTERKKAQEDQQRIFEKLKKTLEGIVEAMSTLIETKDPYTAGHQKRVTLLACAIAKEMGLSQEQIDGLYVASIIHDVGKIYVPSEILSKPGWLSGIEVGLIKTHAQVGYDILRKIDFPWPVAQIVLQHHERLDGSGYPHGRAQDQILLEARILGVADVVEAMGTHRPYRPSLGIDKALEEIDKHSGTLYDKAVVRACIKIFREKGFGFG